MPLSDYDVIVMGDDANDIGDADLYGITLDPLRVFRITADKRISSLDADPTRVVVAAADEQVDKLGYVDASGVISPVPGLGRPFAYTPLLSGDGTLVYSDSVERRGEDIDRFLSFDPSTGRKRVLSTSRTDLFVPTLGPRNEILALEIDDRTPARLVIAGEDGRLRPLVTARPPGYLHWGKRLIATSVEGPPRDDGGINPTGLQLLDPRTGRVRVFDGWDPIAWSPDGTRLLVRDSSDLTNSRLGVLDPADPENVQVLGTLPMLTLYTGSWVRGNA